MTYHFDKKRRGTVGTGKCGWLGVFIFWMPVPNGTGLRYGYTEVPGKWAFVARTAWYGSPYGTIPEGPQ